MGLSCGAAASIVRRIAASPQVYSYAQNMFASLFVSVAIVSLKIIGQSNGLLLLAVSLSYTVHGLAKLNLTHNALWLVYCLPVLQQCLA